MADRDVLYLLQGWKTRKRMKTLRRALPTLQKSFRKKQQQKEETAAHEKNFRLQTVENNLNHRRSFRRTRENQLQSLQIVPAGEECYLVLAAVSRNASVNLGLSARSPMAGVLVK